MKKFIFILLSLVFFSLQAQNLPQGISYQAVAIKKEKVNLGGENLAYIYWSKKDIVVRFSIYDTYPNGNVEYSETHDTKTDDYGVFNLIIGKGDKISGNFEEINWELGDAHLKIEIDFDGFGAFELIGVEKFWSVPYAFVSKKQSNNNAQSDSLFSDLYNKYDYLRNRDKDTVIGNELQKLSRSNDTLVLSDGGGKVALYDQDSTNEIQRLNKFGDTISLTKNGGEFTLNDDDPNNEIQKLTLSNDSLFLSNGGGSVDLSDFIGSTEGSTITTSVRAASTSSICFSGVLVNLESWSNTSGFDFVWPVGEVADSVFVFKAVQYGKNIQALFLHNIKTNKISKIRELAKNTDWQWTGDSVLYIGDPTSGNVEVFYYSRGNLDSITSFANGPLNVFQKVIVNKSKDLIWIDAIKGVQGGTIYKFQFSTRQLKTLTNPSSGKAYGTVCVVSGDTVLLSTRLVNSSNMTVISDITDLQNATFSMIGAIGDKIFYTSLVGSSTLTLNEYNIQKQKKYSYGSLTSFTIIGVNNNELWFEVKMGGGSMAGIPSYRLGNLGLIGDVAIVCSVLPNGMLVNHGYSSSVNLNVTQDSQSRLLGGFYQLSNISSTNCVNNSMPKWDLGYFYSK